MAKPSVYILGSKPRLKLDFRTEDGDAFTPLESRLSIKQPDGQIITYSGGDMTQGSGYLYVLYRPPVIGWYEYEGWGKDGLEQEVAKTKGFEVSDRVY
jgi:hypothetical protein